MKKLCIDLSNSAYIFKSIEDVKEFLLNPNDEGKQWSSWSDVALNLLASINSRLIDN